MKERRKLKRKYLAFFTRVFDAQRGDLLGHLADITAEGLMIISNHPIPTEKGYHLKLDLPDYIFGKSHLDFKAQSIWCQPDIDPSFYNTGFQLQKVTKEDIEIIERIIQEYGIRE